MGKRKQKKTPPKAGSRRGSSRSVEDEEIPPPESAGADYERQRQSRIEENRAKLAALGLPSMAASLEPNRSDEVPDKEDDEEYRPNMDGEDGGEDELSSSSEAFVDEDDDDDDYVNKPLSSLKKSKKSSGKKKVCVKKKKIVRELDFMDEDEALKKAIAFSLEDSGVGCEGVKGSRGKGRSPQLTPKNKGRKSVNANRVQLNEDDVVIHFCQFDEVGKGSINLRDLERMASSHDFTWTDQELMDMIRCFDADGDRKLTIEDFRNIVIRCNMLQASEHP